jgi:hypothetical protein
MKPNHHFAVHIADQLRDYGPVPGFWTFFSERLNKVLKNFNNNHHSNGQIESTMMRSIGRNARVYELVSKINTLLLMIACTLLLLQVTALMESETEACKMISKRLLDDQKEAHGTVQDLAEEAGLIDCDGMFTLHSVSVKRCHFTVE